MEEVMQEYLGFEQFIWLEGAYGGGFDITDSHIDGFLRFRDEHTIVTMNTADLNYWFVNAADRDLIFNALNTDGEAYNYVYLPLTDKNVKTTEGMNTGSKAVMSTTMKGIRLFWFLCMPMTTTAWHCPSCKTSTPIRK